MSLLTVYSAKSKAYYSEASIQISGAVILVKVETTGVSNTVTVNGKVEEGEAALEGTIDVVEAVEIRGEVEIVRAAVIGPLPSRGVRCILCSRQTPAGPFESAFASADHR